ncbi:hypothetical protein Droror1_Dr00026604 [Drosera rotundifolia]
MHVASTSERIELAQIKALLHGIWTNQNQRVHGGLVQHPYFVVKQAMDMVREMGKETEANAWVTGKVRTIEKILWCRWRLCKGRLKVENDEALGVKMGIEWAQMMNRKRDAEEAIEKIVSTKKQKAQNNGVVVAKKITENKTQKKKKQGSSSSDPDDSDSEDEMVRGILAFRAMLQWIASFWFVVSWMIPFADHM